MNDSNPIIVTINGKPIDTMVDGDGVQRLPNRPIIRYLMNRAVMGFHELEILVEGGMVSKDDQRFVYQNVGYSVDGYADVFPGDEIDNPLWNDESSNET